MFSERFGKVNYLKLGSSFMLVLAGEGFRAVLSLFRRAATRVERDSQVCPLCVISVGSAWYRFVA